MHYAVVFTHSYKYYCAQVPAPVDPSGGTPGPVKKKANSTGVSPDKDDDSPTLEQIELVGITERKSNLN